MYPLLPQARNRARLRDLSHYRSMSARFQPLRRFAGCPVLAGASFATFRVGFHVSGECDGETIPPDLRMSNAMAFLRGVMGEDQVARFGLLVAGKAGLHKRLVARLAIGGKVPEPPAAGRSVLC